MKRKEKLTHEGRVINCKSCDSKYHYRYTRDQLVDLYDPKAPMIKPCIYDNCMEAIWLNYKLEDEKIPK